MWEKDFLANGEDLDNFYNIPKEDWNNKTPYCSNIGVTKAYCVSCQSIQEHNVLFFDRDYSIMYSCSGKTKRGFMCITSFIATLDKIDTQDMRNIWKEQPRRVIYDTSE